MEYYYSIDKSSVAEFKDRGSKFIAHAFPVKNVKEFKLKLAAIKKEHSKAVHHCFAYRIGFAGDNYRVNDDGEPSGSAGKPILGQIDSKSLINVAIVVTRYFGGTLLGIPGLIQAYKTASALSIQTTPIVQRPILISYCAEFDYHLQNDVIRILKQSQCVITALNISLFSTILFEVPKNRESEVLFKIQEIRNVVLKKIL